MYHLAPNWYHLLIRFDNLRQIWCALVSSSDVLSRKGGNYKKQSTFSMQHYRWSRDPSSSLLWLGKPLICKQRRESWDRSLWERTTVNASKTTAIADDKTLMQWRTRSSRKSTIPSRSKLIKAFVSLNSKSALLTARTSAIHKCLSYSTEHRRQILIG